MKKTEAFRQVLTGTKIKHPAYPGIYFVKHGPHALKGSDKKIYKLDSFDELHFNATWSVWTPSKPRVIWRRHQVMVLLNEIGRKLNIENEIREFIKLNKNLN
jgi:hypothetical protein